MFCKLSFDINVYSELKQISPWRIYLIFYFDSNYIKQRSLKDPIGDGILLHIIFSLEARLYKYVSLYMYIHSISVFPCLFLALWYKTVNTKWMDLPLNTG